MLVDETASDVKILNAISTIDKDQLEKFNPYRPQRMHLTTRFELLFYHDKIVIHEAMRTTIIAMLHQGHTSATKTGQLAEPFWLPGLYREFREKAETCPSCKAAGKNIKTQILSAKKNRLEILPAPNQDIQIDFVGPIKSKTCCDVYILVAIDRFSKWPTAHNCKNADTGTVLTKC